MPRRFEWTPLYFKEIAVIGSNAFGVEELRGRAPALDGDLPRPRPASDGIDVTPIITHRFSLDAVAARRSSPAATRTESGAVKVLFTYCT